MGENPESKIRSYPNVWQGQPMYLVMALPEHLIPHDRIFHQNRRDMYVMKLMVLTSLLICSLMAPSGGHDGFTAKDPAVIGNFTDMASAPESFTVFPNPFDQKFLIGRIQGKTFVRDVALLDDRGMAVEIRYSQRSSLIYVYVPDAPAGEYTVVVTFFDGSSQTMPITKL